MDEQSPKNKSNTYDFIIVGQGLAGSILALQLIINGYSVCVINNHQLSKSSAVAAGIWNPVVFKRLTKSWLADDLVPNLIDFYTKCEDLFKTKLITKRHIIKPFTQTQEEEFWLNKSKIDNLFLESEIYSNHPLTPEINIPRYSYVLNAGNLDVSNFLEQTQNYIAEANKYIEESFSFNDLHINDSIINYKTITANSIIFCEGHLIFQNPYFNWVPTKPAKGEILTIYCENLKLTHDILNKGIFILPLGNHTYKVGATYEWVLLNDEPSNEGLLELQIKLKDLIQLPFRILKHEAGVRPSVIDRRPVIGAHPIHKNVFVFNGFGTKAVMLAPFFAKQFVNNMQHNTELLTEVDIARFYKNVSKEK